MWLLLGSVLVVLVVWGAYGRLRAQPHSRMYTDHLASSNWHACRQRTLSFSRQRCVLFPFLRARHIHHLHYKNLRHEKVLRDVVPLSLFAHYCVHLWPLWYVPPLRLFVNWYLRCAGLLVAGLMRPSYVIASLGVLAVVVGLLWDVIASW